MFLTPVRRRALAIGAAVVTVLVGVATPAAASQDGIDGVVTNARTGEPIPGAAIVAYTLGGSWAGSASTDDAGHYDIPLAPGEYHLFSMANGMLDQWAFGKATEWDADPVAAPGTASIALVPIEYGSLSGRFVTSAGEPVTNALVQLYTTDQNERGSTSTGADGAFHFTNVQTGDYKLRFTSPSGVVQWAHQKDEPLFYEADTFTVRAGEDTVVTETAFPTGTLSVTVVETDTGDPVEGACVNASGSGTQIVFGCTDATGTTTIDGVRVGTYSLSISPPAGYLYGHVDGVVIAEGQTTSITTDLTKASVVAFSIKNAATGEPVSGACAVLLEVGGSGVVGESYTCSGADGTIELEQYPAGRFRAFVYGADGLGAQWVGRSGGVGDMRDAKVYETKPGATTRIAVRLDRAGSITGVVRAAADNAPVEGVCPSVTPVSVGGPNRVNTVCSQSDGRYEIRGLGPYRWPVEFPDFSGTYAWMWSGNAADRFAAKRISVHAGHAARANASLPLAGKVTGTVLGATLPNQFISVVATNTRTGDIAAPFAFVRNAAEYTLSGLATQHIWIDYNSTGPDMTRYPDPIAVTAGSTVHLDLPEPN